MKWYPAIGCMTFDQVITWQIKNIILQLLQRLQSPDLVVTHMATRWYHCYMSFIIFLYAIHLCHICHVIMQIIKTS